MCQHCLNFLKGLNHTFQCCCKIIRPRSARREISAELIIARLHKIATIILNLHILNKISLDIDDLLLPYTFDLSVYNHITNTDLLAHIARVGKTFYKKN